MADRTQGLLSWFVTADNEQEKRELMSLTWRNFHRQLVAADPAKWIQTALSIQDFHDEDVAESDDSDSDF